MKYFNRLKSIILYFILAIVLNIVLFSYKVEAATFLVTVSKEEVTVGDTFTVTINGTGLTGKYSIKGSSNISITGETTPWIENTSVTITCTAKEAGKATITVTPETVADANTGEDQNLVAKSVSVNVKAPATPAPEQPIPPAPQPETPATKSSEARLNTFGITPSAYDFSGFSKNRDKEDWSTTVPNSVTKVTVYATALGINAKVEGAGKVTLNEGNNIVKVTVTAEAGNTKTYTLTIKRKTAAEETAENGEARLKSLGIKPEEYDFTGFDSEKTEYSVEVPNEVEEIEVYATAMNSSAQITGTGMIELKEGKNELKVEVIAANGAKKTYTLEVTRKEKDGVSGTTEEKIGLESLSIEGLTLKPSFKVETYEYTVELTEDLTELNIQAKANDEDATVEIYGNENLQQGENIITIQVTNEETKKMATYQIIVNKNVAEETVQTSWLKPSTWGQEEKIKIAIIIGLIILIICAIVLKINISKENKNANKLDLPGAEELDKAMAEHQELSEEQSYTDNTEDIQRNQIEQNYIEDIAKNKFGEVKDETDEKTKRKGRHF